MRIPGQKTKGYKEGQIRRLLGDEPCYLLDNELGCVPIAVDTTIKRLDPNDPTGKKYGPPERAFVCRLYPRTPEAIFAFGMAKVECAECIYFPDQDEDLELIFLRGFHEAALQAKALLKQHQAGQNNQRPSGTVVPRSI